MPELPEVETVRQTLAANIIGRRVAAVRIHRPDVIDGPANAAALLTGQVLTDVIRHGKQFAIVGGESLQQACDAVPCVCVHLGMTGSLRHIAAGATGGNGSSGGGDHIHVTWKLDDGSVLQFRDPRRFGGLWPTESVAMLRGTRWAQLGPDALVIAPRALHDRLERTRRAIKATLLDQAVVAGLGNIYVDELLFAAGLHPATLAHLLSMETTRSLVSLMRRLLKRAIRAGGSTLRDYVDAAGRTGRFQQRHKVYGRAGNPCVTCETPLTSVVLAGRTTVFCEACQYDSLIKKELSSS